jgi:hypothetical protein
MPVYTHEFYGTELRSGDLICTTDGEHTSFYGALWRVFGHLVPGPVDHVAIYVGPGPHFVEAGPFGVLSFDMPGDTWESTELVAQRGFLDRIYGIVQPLVDPGLPPEVQERMRDEIRTYVLRQAELRKPYNLNFLQPDTEDSFYCSQLAYLAYRRHGINLKTRIGVPDLALADQIIFPIEIWHAGPTRMYLGKP